MVAHYLEFNLFVALDALLYQYLVNGGEVKGIAHHVAELFFVVCEAAAGAAKGEGRAKDYGVADLLCGLYAFLDAVADLGRNDGLVNGEAEFLEELAVFGFLDIGEICTQDFYAALFQNAFLGKLNGKVEACLAAKAGNQCIRALVSYYLGNVVKFERLHINLVGYMGIGHDGGGVGVNQDNLVAFFFQCKAGLCACIVEFCCLADDDGAGAYNHYFLDVCSSRHCGCPPSF